MHPDDRSLAEEPLAPLVAQHIRDCPRCRISRRLLLSLLAEEREANTLPQEGLAPQPALDLGPRYAVKALLGAGGMGEVHRVRDEALGRDVALKILRRHFDARAEARFLAEARATAQLQHPSIVPVYDLGQLPDGRSYYTMPAIEGVTLADAMSRKLQGDPPRALVAVLRQIASAVGYAHRGGVLHRDLKPANIMLGAFGAVYVLDWGLSAVRDVGEPPIVDVDRSAFQTRAGTIAGTPVYMAPEQATAGLSQASPASDVYALGAILYEILTGRPPYAGTAAEVLAQVRAGPFPALPKLPESQSALAKICTRATARAPNDRYPDAGALAEALGRWLDGEAQRAEAEQLVAEAEALRPEAEALFARASALQAEAERLAQALPSHGPLAERVALWRIEDEAAELQVQAEALEARRADRLGRAISAAPERREARSALGAWYRRRLLAAEARRERAEVARWAGLLSGLDAEAHASFLSGEGEIEELITAPAGARVRWLRGETRDRRIRWIDEGEIGRTPLLHRRLPMGSHLLLLEHPDCEPVRYPVYVPRCGLWSARPPGEGTPMVIELPERGQLSAEEVYVPGGWFLARLGGRPRAVWVDPFIVARFPVTNAQYLAFLEDLAARGEAASADGYVPKRAGAAEPAPMLVRTAEGRYIEPDGVPFDPLFPVVYVRWSDAVAFAAERARDTGLPWRLPSELEWEKAAAGVDGRLFPLGDHADPSWANTLHTRPKPWPCSIHDYPEDESVYGMRGPAGNVADWMLDPFTEPGPRVLADGRAEVAEVASASGYRSTRGGTWIWHQRYSACAYRTSHREDTTSAEIGFRLARSLTPLPADRGARAI